MLINTFYLYREKLNKKDKGKLVEKRGRKATSLKHDDAMTVGVPMKELK